MQEKVNHLPNLLPAPGTGFTQIWGFRAKRTGTKRQSDWSNAVRGPPALCVTPRPPCAPQAHPGVPWAGRFGVGRTPEQLLGAGGN